jgi:hypothetical protein
MSIDVVNLIERNHITTFSNEYTSKLSEKFQNSFTTYEQQLFLSSFYCYLTYNTKNDFVIDLDNIWNWLGFSSKFNAKRLLENNFKINDDYKILLHQMEKQPVHTKGGHNKETILLNINTFKKFCLKTCTKKADEVHDYFIKLENIMFEITKEESEELKKQVLTLENKTKEMEEKNRKQRNLEKEQYMLKHFANIGNIIYIIKVKTYNDGCYVVKIGESRRGIQNRYGEHKLNYEECLLLDCFEVDKSKDFETFLHHHSLIYPSKVNNLQNHEKENELFLIGNNLKYQTLLEIIHDNIDNYNYKVKELLLEIENIKLKNSGETINNTNALEELINSNKMLLGKVNSLEIYIKQILNKLNEKETKLTSGFNEQLPHLGPRVQKINPETLNLIKIYESVTEVMNEDKNIKRPSINKAIQNNTIYCGFRWLLVERNLDPRIIYNIEPTKQTKNTNLGYIAKLNTDKTEIINIYIDRKTAAKLNGYKSLSALDNHVKNKTITKNFYYILYEKCEESLIKKFENKNGIPLLYKNGVGQYDLKNNLLKVFPYKYACIKELKMSDKTLTKALQYNIPYNNYYYRELESKTYI